MQQHVWLRAETCDNERRTLLTPKNAHTLIRNGHRVTVEQSPLRCIPVSEYENVGCEIAPESSWPDAPRDAVIFGLRPLADASFDLIHRHMYFAHVFEGQQGSQKVLARYKKGRGFLFDLERLTDRMGNQVATAGAGYIAGLCGAVASLLIWIQKQKGVARPYSIPLYFENEQQMRSYLSAELNQLLARPSILVIAPHGMVGKGVRSILTGLDLPYTSWSRAEMPGVGPYPQINDFNIFFNCIKLGSDRPLFIDHCSLREGAALSVIGDIACDPLHPDNPIMLYSDLTPFADPTARAGEVDIMGVGNITTMLPHEASIDMGDAVFPYLCWFLMLGEHITKESDSAWGRAVRAFELAMQKI